MLLLQKKAKSISCCQVKKIFFMKYLNAVISGTGSYIPPVIVKNVDFINQQFYEKDESTIESPGEIVINKFKDITGISERRWVTESQSCSEIGAIAAQQAIDDSGIDPETLDYIILAHNFGDVLKDTIQTDAVPSLAARIKHHLKIKNPNCVAYDILFGCPGWIQGMIQAYAYIRSGMAKRCLIIGAETLSRVVDVYDRDTMIFSDGAGAVILEAHESDTQHGILSSAAVTHSLDEIHYLNMGKSNIPGSDPRVRYIKMNGRRVYEYAVMNVPQAMKAALDKSNIPAADLDKILIHQANEKMDEAIVKRFFKLCGINKDIAEMMPMNIRELGNSSVATVPTLYDMVLKGKIPGHKITEGDLLIFASVGAGMNINAIVYRQ